MRRGAWGLVSWRSFQGREVDGARMERGCRVLGGWVNGLFGWVQDFAAVWDGAAGRMA